MSAEKTPHPNNSSETPKTVTPEKEITPEQGKLLESAVKFSEYLTNRWPQTEDSKGSEPKINYYLSGSLASMLLSRAESFSEMDETRIPALVETKTRKIPDSGRKMLASFARQIGDVDYVPADHYKNNPSRLKKGGGGPSFAEIPEEGRVLLKQVDGQVKVMCDPVESYGSKKISKIEVGGKDYFIARPDTLLAYKVLHLLQSYEQKPEKFNADFTKLFDALKEIYSEEELTQSAQQVLSDFEDAKESSYVCWNENKDNLPAYEKQVPKFIERVLANPQLSPKIRTMLEKLK